MAKSLSMMIVLLGQIRLRVDFQTQFATIKILLVTAKIAARRNAKFISALAGFVVETSQLNALQMDKLVTWAHTTLLHLNSALAAAVVSMTTAAPTWVLDPLEDSSVNVSRDEYA